jgi:GH35 family endo-1,4-beta-xylanase
MYNDYDLLTNDPVKQNQVIDLILELQDRGASIEGLGIQGHLSTPILVTPENVSRKPLRGNITNII